MIAELITSTTNLKFSALACLIEEREVSKQKFSPRADENLIELSEVSDEKSKLKSKQQFIDLMTKNNSW